MAVISPLTSGNTWSRERKWFCKPLLIPDPRFKNYSIRTAIKGQKKFYQKKKIAGSKGSGNNSSRDSYSNKENYKILIRRAIKIEQKILDPLKIEN